MGNEETLRCMFSSKEKSQWKFENIYNLKTLKIIRNLRDVAKVVFKREFIDSGAYIEKKAKINETPKLRS